MYLLFDNWHVQDPIVICPFSQFFDATSLERLFLTNIESVHKDVECALLFFHPSSRVFALALIHLQHHTRQSPRVELPTPCWLRIPPSAGSFRLAKTAHNTQTADSNKTSVTAELPRAQLVSLRPTTASPPWLSPKNTTILVLLQRNQYFVAKPTAATKHRHHELLLCLPSLLSPVRNIARVWHADETKKCRSTRVATLWWQWRQHLLEFF
jgi:hypothetical protein